MPVGASCPEPSDRELLSRAAAGDGDAFAAIFERYQHVVYRFARAMTGSADAAEDITQEVFMILIRELARYAPDRSALSTYLYGIARNLSRDRARRERRFLPLESIGLGKPAAARRPGDPFEQMASEETGADVRRALAMLPPKYREVVILFDLHDLSYADVAAVIRTTVGAVRSRLHRGRHMLRHRLRKQSCSSVQHDAGSIRCSV